MKHFYYDKPDTIYDGELIHMLPDILDHINIFKTGTDPLKLIFIDVNNIIVIYSIFKTPYNDIYDIGSLRLFYWTPKKTHIITFQQGQYLQTFTDTLTLPQAIESISTDIVETRIPCPPLEYTDALKDKFSLDILKLSRKSKLNNIL